MLTQVLRTATLVLPLTLVLPWPFISGVQAQQRPSINSSTITMAVPRLVRLSIPFHPASGQPSAAIESATLSVYADETGGARLWQEVQNLSMDSDGKYTALLGSTRNEGLPVDLFATNQSRWLGVQFNRPGEVEQARVLMTSVPYAMKAGDAETLGGYPASAYLLATSVNQGAATGSPAANTFRSTTVVPRANSGATGYIGKFSNSTDLVSSTLFDNSGKVGLGTTSPSDFFHVRFTDTTGAYTGFAVQNMGNTNTSYSGMLFFDQNGALGQFQGFNNVTHEYRINNVASTPSINFMLNSTSKFLVSSTGNIGIGTTAPKSALQVASGDLYISTAGSGVILKSPSGSKCARFSVDNTGALATPEIICP